jgi:hypothetical protein
MFQAAMGWEDCHLHAFDMGGERYGMQFADYSEGELDEKAFRKRSPQPRRAVLGSACGAALPPLR